MKTNWMKIIPDCSPISEINTPGTHDSCTKYVSFPLFSRCQNKDIAEQLNNGIRFLDIRVEKYNNRLKIVHGISDCRKSNKPGDKLFLEDVINICSIFLKENPSETIFLCLKRDDGAGSEETFDTFYDNHLCEGNWFTENRIPILREVRGKIVLLNRCHIDKKNKKYNDLNTGINLSDFPHQEKYMDKAFEIINLKNRNGENTTEFFAVQDFYGSTAKEKWNFAVFPFLENTPQDSTLCLNFLSCVGKLRIPLVTKSRVLKNFKSYTLEKDKKYGWIIMDYPTDELIDKIISSNHTESTPN